MWRFLGMGEQKLVQMIQVTWPRWQPFPYVVETFKTLPWNRKADDLEPWYAASGTSSSQYYLVCSNDDPGLTVTYFTARSNLVPNVKSSIVVYDIKVGRCSQLTDYMKLEYQRSGSFTDLVPNHTDSIFLNFLSSLTTDFNIFSAIRWAIQDQWSSGIKMPYLYRRMKQISRVFSDN